MTDELAERAPLRILGRNFGTYTGWDGDDETIMFYGFEPCDVLADDLKACDVLQVNWQDGTAQSMDENGLAVWTVDLVNIANMIQRTEP